MTSADKGIFLPCWSLQAVLMGWFIIFDMNTKLHRLDYVQR